MFGPGGLFVVADVIAVLVRQAAAAAANDAAHGDLDLSILSPNLPIAPPTTAPAPAPATATAGGVGLGLAATSYTPVRPNLFPELRKQSTVSDDKPRVSPGGF